MAELAMQQIITTVAGMAATGVIGYLAATGKEARQGGEGAEPRSRRRPPAKTSSMRSNATWCGGEHMTIARYDEIIREYDAYKVLGGNGTAEAYMDEIRKKRPYLVTE